MFGSIIQSMLPPGFDLEKTLDDAKKAIATVVSTVQRIETKQDAILARLDALSAGMPRTVHQPFTEDNNDLQQRLCAPGNGSESDVGTGTDHRSTDHHRDGAASSDGDGFAGRRRTDHPAG